MKGREVYRKANIPLKNMRGKKRARERDEREGETERPSGQPPSPGEKICTTL